MRNASLYQVSGENSAKARLGQSGQASLPNSRPNNVQTPCGPYCLVFFQPIAGRTPTPCGIRRDPGRLYTRIPAENVNPPFFPPPLWLDAPSRIFRTRPTISQSTSRLAFFRPTSGDYIGLRPSITRPEKLDVLCVYYSDVTSRDQRAPLP